MSPDPCVASICQQQQQQPPVRRLCDPVLTAVGGRSTPIMRGPDASLPVWLQTGSPVGLAVSVECRDIFPTVQQQQRTYADLRAHSHQETSIGYTPHLCDPVLKALGDTSMQIMRGPGTSFPVWLQTGAPLGLAVPVEGHGIFPTLQRQQPSVNDVRKQGGEWTNYRDVGWIFAQFATATGTSSQDVTCSSV
jgi:hypothetical protein